MDKVIILGMWLVWSVIMVLILSGQNPLVLMGAAGTKAKELGVGAKNKAFPPPETLEQQRARIELEEKALAQRDRDLAHEIRAAELENGYNQWGNLPLTDCGDEDCQTCFPTPLFPVCGHKSKDEEICQVCGRGKNQKALKSVRSKYDDDYYSYNYRSKYNY